MKKNTAIHLLLFAVIALAQTTATGALVDDRNISIASRSDATRMRKQLIRFVWGSDRLPAGKPKSVTRGVSSPVAGLANIDRVDALEIEMECGQRTVTYHFVPKQRNDCLVVVHQGHTCEIDSYGVGGLIRDLVSEGYSVLGSYMPKCRPGDCTGSCTAQHNEMFKSLHPQSGSPMKFFLEPIAVSLNYLSSRHQSDDFPRYREFDMAGLSGGGWTTTVYAAVDPRIKFSFPVAGTIPLYLRSDGSVGDAEQMLPEFYRLAGYPDLYVLGSFGRGRMQAQILNRRDDCCFGEAQHRGPPSYDGAVRDYEKRVQGTLQKLRAGTFRLEIDELAPRHLISTNASSNVILHELNRHKDR